MNFPFAACGVATGDCDNIAPPTQSMGFPHAREWRWPALTQVRVSISYAVAPLQIEG